MSDITVFAVLALANPFQLITA